MGAETVVPYRRPHVQSLLEWEASSRRLPRDPVNAGAITEFGSMTRIRTTRPIRIGGLLTGLLTLC